MTAAGPVSAEAEAEPATERKRSDGELVRQVLDGRRHAFAELVHRHQAGLFGHARGMGLDRDTAEDLVQDALVRAYERLAECRDPDRFGLWVFRIFRHRCLDHLKNIRRRSVPLEDVVLEADRGRPEADAALAELRDDLGSALSALPDDLRDAFLMKHHEGRSYQEMAEIAEASVSAMKMRVHRAREALRDALGEPDR